MASGGLVEIGKYKIIEQIGEGAMGVVYRALDPVINRPVAIKVMADSIARDDVLRGRFLREAQAAGSLQHPNVVTIYDFGEVDGHLYIAMEFVDGEDLEAIQANKRPLTTLQKVDIMIDVLGGLAYAHKRGIIHRDIKPANIRIDTEGRARLMDFGIAHLTSSKVTRTGTTVGTPAYMAPEQITGGEIGPASDLFSVGAMMFELMTGTKAFDGESLHSVFYNIVSAPAPHLGEFSSDLLPELDVIVQKALAKEPQDRYESALDMANALTTIRRQLDSIARKSKSVSLRSQIDVGLSTRPTVPITPAKRPSRKAVYIGAGGGVVAIGLAVALLLPAREPATGPQTPVPQELKSAPSPTTAVASPATGSSNAASITPAGKTQDPAPPTTKASAPKEAAKTAPAVSQRDLEVFRSMQSTALDARRRAAEAGASADQLQVGDDENDRAAAFAMGGKTVDAAARLNAATRAWLKAESDARAAAAAAAAAAANTAKQRTVEPEKPPPIATPPVTQANPTVVAPAPVTAAPPASNPSAEIAAAVAAYAHAVELRDINEVRRAFPGVSAAQVSGFEQFFSSVRSLRATMTLGSLDLKTTTAEGRVTGQYDYVTTSGKTERQPLDFQASFQRDGTAWKLVAVRANR